MYCGQPVQSLRARNFIRVCCDHKNRFPQNEYSLPQLRLNISVSPFRLASE